MIPITYIYTMPVRCFMEPQPMPSKDYHDAREQTVQVRPEVPVPSHLVECSEESARYHRQRQREERVAALQAMFYSDVEGFDRWFRKLHADDKHLVFWFTDDEAGSHASVLLKTLNKKDGGVTITIGNCE